MNEVCKLLRPAAAGLLYGTAVLSGCMTTARVDPLREAVVGIGNELQRVNSQVGDIKSKVVKLDQSVSKNDDWTVRLLAGGLLLMGLTYPAGKALWLLGKKVSKRKSASNEVAECG